jgi:hypothetical protein
LLVLAAQFVPQVFQIRRGTWLAVAVGMIGLLFLLAWAVFTALGWLWDQGKTLTTGAPEAVRAIASQVEQAVPGAREKLGEVLPAIKPEPPLRDVSGTDFGPVARFPGLARSHWHREGREITVGYEGRADYVAVLEHYTKGFAAQDYAQHVMSARPDAESHDYRKGDELVRFEINRLPQGKVKATIVGVLP